MQLRLCVLGAWMNLQPLVWVSLSRSLVVEKQAAALLKAARYPTLINMHGQTANQTLVVSCWGREVENVEKEGGKEKHKNTRNCSAKSGWMTSAGLLLSLF